MVTVFSSKLLFMVSEDPVALAWVVYPEDKAKLVRAGLASVYEA